MKTLSRRQLLKASALLPFLPAALARAAPLPFTPARNLVVLFHPNGLEPGWKPSVVSGQLVLPPVLSALEPFASKLLCVHGLKNGVRNEVRAHAEGMAGMFTGALIPKNDAYSAWPSFDQLIAEQVGRDAPFPSLELGVQSQVGFGAGGNDSVMIYDRAGKRQPEDDPSAVFRRLFSTAASPEAQAKARASRQSVLDLVKANLSRIRPAYGASEQRKLDAHLDGVRALERRFDELATVQCTGATAPPAMSNAQLNGSDRFPTVMELQFDLLTTALQCGLTRVASVQLSNSVSDRRIPGVNPSLGVHPTMHTGNRTDKVRINQFFVGAAARLLAKLEAVKRPDGSSLLDETLVVWGTEMAVGNHLRDPVPFFVAGGPQNGLLNSGLLELTEGHRTTRLLLSVMQAMGVTPPPYLGDLSDESSRGALPGAGRST